MGQLLASHLSFCTIRRLNCFSNFCSRTTVNKFNDEDGFFELYITFIKVSFGMF